MCGINGIVSRQGHAVLPERLRRMTASLHHRGPDDEGLWIDAHGRVGLGHRRLAIIDVSHEGHQPMASVSDRYQIVYNGEIYNFQQLRDELAAAGFAPVWRGHSDTEVLLACVDAWGLAATLPKLVGMFAIALWDHAEATLSLARDRLGEKPIYYGTVDGDFAFASELKSLRAASRQNFEVDRNALAEYMRFGYVPGPSTIFQGLHKLQPGHVVTHAARGGHTTRPEAFWALSHPASLALETQYARADDKTLLDAVDNGLRTAVAGQMIADVPLGAFLSGGVDSSTVVAMMQAQSSRRVRTYTIGFRDDSFNEAPYARAVAQHLGTEHTELIITASEASALIPALPQIYDEPFADSSQIPTVLISRLTRNHVTVALSGDGGDELFAGYPRYAMTSALWQKWSRLPLSMRRVGASALQAPSPAAWDRLLSCWPLADRRQVNGRRIHHAARLMSCESLDETYVRLMSRWQPEDALVLGAAPLTFHPLLDDGVPGPRGDIDSMRRWDISHYLPDDLLVKVDRAAMSAGLETRAPLLDHRVVEMALALPEHMLVRDGVGKWALRQILDRYVPRELIDRPKAGFEIPLADWLRGPLRAWAEPLLDPKRIAREGFLDAVKVTTLWSQHLTGRWDRSLYLWNILMFEAWLDSGVGAAT